MAIAVVDSQGQLAATRRQPAPPRRDGATALEGGVPIVIDGNIVVAIGVPGVLSTRTPNSASGRLLVRQSDFRSSARSIGSACRLRASSSSAVTWLSFSWPLSCRLRSIHMPIDRPNSSRRESPDRTGQPPARHARSREAFLHFETAHRGGRWEWAVSARLLRGERRLPPSRVPSASAAGITD